MFCSSYYFSVFLLCALALVFAPEEGGGGSQLLKALLLSRLLSALLIDTLNLLG